MGEDSIRHRYEVRYSFNEVGIITTTAGERAMQRNLNSTNRTAQQPRNGTI